MIYFALLSPGTIIEPPSRPEDYRTSHANVPRIRSTRNTRRGRFMFVVLMFTVIAAGCGMSSRFETRRDDSCIVVDEVQNIDTQRNVDCFER
ncbi:MAG: hypothetical protein JWO19_2274 [Bryobacterales bacterium]|nr:hypothetical protein [Bryobacterales bacterium]